jgi:hypothetical protein
VAPKPTRIEAPIRTFWDVKARGTRVLQFLVKHVPADGHVAISCRGKGCPFRSKTVKVKGSRANALSLFKRRRLRPGTRVEVRITAPDRIGRVVRYTIARNKLPTSRDL